MLDEKRMPCENGSAMKRKFVNVRNWHAAPQAAPREQALREQIRRHEIGAQIARARLLELLAAQLNRG